MIQELCPNESPKLSELWHRFFFREWILCEYCRWLTSSKGVDAYHFLVSRSWYSAEEVKIHSKISLEMEREANIALGSRYYNSSDEKERINLFYIVNKLIGANKPRKTETAFHLIRHTKPTNGIDPNKINIDPIFHEMLRKIYLSNYTDRTISIYRELFRHNLKDFDALDKARLSRVAKNNRLEKSGQRR
jgi:hypothetical protein